MAAVDEYGDINYDIFTYYSTMLLERCFNNNFDQLELVFRQPLRNCVVRYLLWKTQVSHTTDPQNLDCALLFVNQYEGGPINYNAILMGPATYPFVYHVYPNQGGSDLVFQGDERWDSDNQDDVHQYFVGANK